MTDFQNEANDAYTQIGKRMRKIYKYNERYRLFDLKNVNGLVNKTDASIQCAYMIQKDTEFERQESAKMHQFNVPI